MTTRKVLAAATLTAIPLFVGAAQPGSHRAGGDAAHERHITERPSGPRALYWAGLDGETAILAGIAVGLDTMSVGWALSTAL